MSTSLLPGRALRDRARAQRHVAEVRLGVDGEHDGGHPQFAVEVGDRVDRGALVGREVLARRLVQRGRERGAAVGIHLDVHVHVERVDRGDVDGGAVWGRRHEAASRCSSCGQRRKLLADALQRAAELGVERCREVVVRPAALPVARLHRLGVGPELDAVAADTDGLPGDACRGIRCEIGDEAGDVVGRAESEVVPEELGHGLARGVGLDGRSEVRHGRGHRRRGDRDDGVDRDLGLAQLERPGAHHADDAGLRGGVVGLTEVAALAGRRADADDAPALARVRGSGSPPRART